jgi:hypothetical protein
MPEQGSVPRELPDRSAAQFWETGLGGARPVRKDNKNKNPKLFS